MFKNSSRLFTASLFTLFGIFLAMSSYAYELNDNDGETIYVVSDDHQYISLWSVSDQRYVGQTISVESTYGLSPEKVEYNAVSDHLEFVQGGATVLTVPASIGDSQNRKGYSAFSESSSSDSFEIVPNTLFPLSKDNSWVFETFAGNYDLTVGDINAEAVEPAVPDDSGLSCAEAICFYTYTFSDGLELGFTNDNERVRLNRIRHPSLKSRSLDKGGELVETTYDIAILFYEAGTQPEENTGLLVSRIGDEVGASLKSSDSGYFRVGKNKINASWSATTTLTEFESRWGIQALPGGIVEGVQDVGPVQRPWVEYVSKIQTKGNNVELTFRFIPGIGLSYFGVKSVLVGSVPIIYRLDRFAYNAGFNVSKVTNEFVAPEPDEETREESGSETGEGADNSSSVPVFSNPPRQTDLIAAGESSGGGSKGHVGFLFFVIQFSAILFRRLRRSVTRMMYCQR